MKRRTLLISGIAGATAVVLGGGTVLVATAKADADAHADYDKAVDAHAAAIAAFNTAQRNLNDAQLRAADLAQTARPVAGIDPALLDDATTATALVDAVAALATAAALTDTEGVFTAPEALKAMLVPKTTAPADRAKLGTAAADLRGTSKKLATQTKALTTETAAITTAIADTDAATSALVASAYRHGSATAPPDRASADAIAAYTAAVTALDAPAADANLAALVLAYRDAWNAAVASDAAARSTTGAAAATYINGVLIVNKTYGLPSTFGNGLTTDTSNAFAAMQAAGAAAGHNIYISSGFRSFSAQTNVYNKYKANEGQDGADKHSARPGHSEHQSGLAFDLNSITQAFGSTPEGIWTAQNAHLYGFIVRYPQGKEGVTGYIWEPWHLRYLGVDLATTLYTNGQTLEEYLGVTSVYS